MLMANDRVVLLPQVPLAFTVMFPPAVPEVAVMLLVVEVPVQPEGSVQVYEVAPFTAVTEYVCVVAGQTAALPAMVPGCAGIARVVMANVLAVLLPQVLEAITEILPEVVPVVTVIELVVDVPVQPEGSVHA